MSVWVTPKTDWNGNANEYFNITDYQRIKGNIEFLSDYLKEIDIDMSLSYPMENATYLTIPKASFYNNIVYNIDELRDYLPTVKGFKTMRQYVAKQRIWTFEDLNIIENNLLCLKQVIDSKYLARNKLPFKLGMKGEI